MWLFLQTFLSLSYQITISSAMMVIIFLAVFGQYAKSQNAGCYSNCQEMGYYDCNICYDSCPTGRILISNDTNTNGTEEYAFTLKTCTQTYCAYYVTQVISNGKITTTITSCGEYKQRDLSQSDCIKSCCDNPGYSTFTNDTYNQCVAKNEELHKTSMTVLMIIGIVFGGIVSIIIMVFVIACIVHKIKKCWLQNNNRISPTSTNNQSNNQLNEVLGNQLQNIQPPKNYDDNKNSTRVYHEISITSSPFLTWTQVQYNQKQSTEQYCSICLDGKMNCITPCGHKFHLMCIESWIRKNPSCPICKNQSINDLKIYCQVCSKRQASYHLKIYQDKIIPVSTNKIICDQCTMKEKLTSEKFTDVEKET